MALALVGCALCGVCVLCVSLCLVRESVLCAEVASLYLVFVLSVLGARGCA